MRLGILLGFLIGAAIAALLGAQEREPSGEGAAPGGGLKDKIRMQAERARIAAQEASEEKQAEMLQDWERARHHDA